MCDIKDLWDSIQDILKKCKFLQGYKIVGNKLILMINLEKEWSLEYRSVIEKLMKIGVPESSIFVYYLKGMSCID